MSWYVAPLSRKVLVPPAPLQLAPSTFVATFEVKERPKHRCSSKFAAVRFAGVRATEIWVKAS